MKKFLVIQTAFIGDAILATALLEKLHAHYPAAQIDFLIRKGNEALFANHPFLNELLIWDKKGGKYRNLLRLLARIRKQRYDLVVNVQRFAATGMLTAFCGAKQTSGFNKNPWSFLFTRSVKHVIQKMPPGMHETDRNQALISHITDDIAAKPGLYPGPAAYQAMSGFMEGEYICIAPASVWFTKQFPANKWVNFIREIGREYRIYLVGGPADHELCDTVCAEAKHPGITNLAGKLNLLESAALMSGARMNYVNDSSPLHLASAMNAPVTAIYCSTVPAFGFGPLSEVSHIIETKEILACKPCGLHGYRECPLKHFACAHTISTGQLLETLPDG